MLTITWSREHASFLIVFVVEGEIESLEYERTTDGDPKEGTIIFTFCKGLKKRGGRGEGRREAKKGLKKESLIDRQCIGGIE